MIIPEQFYSLLYFFKARKKLFPCRFQEVETRCCEDIADIWNCPYHGVQPSGTQVEFHLVMRIDEIESPVNGFKAFLSHRPLKQLYRAFGLLDVQQFSDASLVFLPIPQYPLIQSRRKQVKERQVREEAASAYLLMPTERHLPSRKGHENYPPRVFNNCLHLCINSSLSSICSITSWQTIRSN